MFRSFPAMLSPLLLLACVHAPPKIEGGSAAPVAPNAKWAPPASTIDRSRPAQVPTLTQTLTLAEIVDIALRNNPATRISWAQARTAAEALGVQQGTLYPSISADVGVTRLRSLAAPGRPAGERTQYGPTLNLAYTVLDFGGRSGAIDVARQTAIAADFAHNATIENTILDVESATFTYLANRALRDAQIANKNEAAAALDAANDRHEVGLATIADVLQARTAKSQAELALETLQGSVAIARGNVAVAMGLPANARFEVPEPTTPDSVHFVTASVDSLIDAAVRNRPELAAARAEAAGAVSEVKVARSARLPFLGISAVGASNSASVSTFTGRTYTLNFGVQIPLFTGFAREYEERVAQAQVQVAQARADMTKQQITQQVFNAYYALSTSTNRVRASVDLLGSATQSESVARGRYREGVGSIVDLLVAQSALANARAQSVEARWQWRTALAQLAHDVGVLGIRGESLLPGSDAGAGRKQ